jgi:O-methyltransferase involved in polyketide biosynthesis
MTAPKQKILLKAEQATLLIPLYSKAKESCRPNCIFKDPKAEEILSQVDYDFSRLRTPRKTVIMLCFRANKLDDYAREFIARYSEGVVLHLGCGLDSRCQRVGRLPAKWYDLDFPEVIELRRKFFPESENYHLIPSSVTDLEWTGQVDAKDRPVLVIAEGLFMYLEGDEIKALVKKLQAAFPGCRLAFDAFSVLTAASAKGHPGLRKTGAVTKWGIDDAHALETWSSGIRLQDEWFFIQAEELEHLNFVYRNLFKFAGQFKVVNQAHRILFYQL